jgi:Zn finger protein HypA/HybF involved in hydrogenase expression
MESRIYLFACLNCGQEWKQEAIENVECPYCLNESPEIGVEKKENDKPLSLMT